MSSQLAPNGHEIPNPQERPASAPADTSEQMQHVFHELHANGRNALCSVCDGQYRDGQYRLA